MPFTREQAYQALADLNPAPVFLQSYQVRPLPEHLENFFGPPEEFFIDPDIQDVYTQGRLIPILDDGNFGLVTFVEPEKSTLSQLWVEEPDGGKTTFTYWQQYLASLMVRIAAVREVDQARLRRISDLVQFTHLDELFDHLRAQEERTGDDLAEAARQFPFQIGL